MKLDFSISRFTAYSRIRMTQGMKLFALIILVFLLVSIALLGLSVALSEGEKISSNVMNISELFFMLMVPLGGMIITSNSFDNLQNKRTTFSGLLLPVSAWEKLVFEFLYSFVFWVFISIAAIKIYAYNSHMLIGYLYPYLPSGNHPSDLLEFTPFTLVNLIYYHSLFFFGSLFFKSWKLVKSLFSILIIHAILLGLYFAIWNLIFADSAPPMGSEIVERLTIGDFTSNELMDWYNSILLIVFGVLVPGLMYYASFKRLKSATL